MRALRESSGAGAEGAPPSFSLELAELADDEGERRDDAFAAEASPSFSAPADPTERRGCGSIAGDAAAAAAGAGAASLSCPCERLSKARTRALRFLYVTAAEFLDSLSLSLQSLSLSLADAAPGTWLEAIGQWPGIPREPTVANWLVSRGGMGELSMSSDAKTFLFSSITPFDRFLMVGYGYGYCRQ